MKFLSKLFPNKKQESNKTAVRLFFSGFAMGAADIVPGVSGGTIALIVGVYEELIQSIKHVSGKVLRLAAKGKIKEAFYEVPFSFLIPLGAGLLTAVVTLSKGLEWLLMNQPALLWSFFFGLVLASVYVVGRRVKDWEFPPILALVLGAALAFFIVGLVPSQTPANPIAFFLSGAIAICAMILPGVSGSFLLIIMGKYAQILSAVSDRDIITLGLVAAGAVTGLALFSRVLSWLFNRYHDLVIALLTGFMIGSLRKIWPWKEVLETYLDSHGVEMPLVERNVLPQSYDQFFLYSIMLMFIGAIFILYISKFDAEEK